MEKEHFLIETQQFLNDYVVLASLDRNHKVGNEKVLHSAVWYEKFRTAVEYQEEHLIFKNAVSRIIRRKFTLSFSVSAESLFEDLMSELAWADYLNLETLTNSEIEKIKSIIDRYLVLLNSVQSHKMAKFEAQKVIISWMASEIDNVLFSRKRQELLVDYTYFCLKDNLNFAGNKAEEKKSVLQLKLAIFTILFKPDYAYAQFWLVKKLFPAFNDFSHKDAQDIGKHFDNITYHLDVYLRSRYTKYYLAYAKKYIAPFSLIKELPNYEKDLSQFNQDPEKLKNKLMVIYDRLIKKSKDRVWRGTFRALIFIFLTKISLAFVIEMPFDQYLRGSIDYLPLMVNVFLPPLLMFFAGISAKNPPNKNRELVYQATDNLIKYQKIDTKPYFIGESRKTSLEKFFNLLYFIFNLAIVGLVIYFLDKIGFNIVSIILFFLFISAVSFFSFRIRNITMELVMRLSKENMIVSAIEFVFLPFILIGKFFSATLTRSNPFTITLDYLIEAPLKSIIKITASWLRFVRQKKEDIDI